MYSVADRASYEKIPELVKHIQKVRDADQIPCILVGNKSDLDPDDRITEEEGQELAAKFNIPFYETSAKCAQNIQECYIELVRIIRKNGGSQKQVVNKSRGMSVVRRQGINQITAKGRSGTAIGKLLNKIRSK